MRSQVTSRPIEIFGSASARSFRKKVDPPRPRKPTLFDQPYEDNKRVRVCGPFSVESLSPHRVLSATEDNAQPAPANEREARKQTDFATMIVENLRKAGVQNTIRNERLVFDTLEPYAGGWLNAAGTYTDANGAERRVAVSLGPEQGALSPEQVKEAAKEAVQELGFETLVVCGFAFDPHVSEETRRFGKLQVLIARMNPDLSMGNELLKKTGAGNLFMVFGEPDIDLNTLANGQLSVEIKGVDVYDPTTGEVRKSSTDDIACWFIDTNYNGESFFVRHAYFTGKEKLKRVLRAEIDETAWASLYKTTSRPFTKLATGRIAVKVINYYGDEVLKVFVPDGSTGRPLIDSLTCLSRIDPEHLKQAPVQEAEILIGGQQGKACVQSSCRYPNIILAHIAGTLWPVCVRTRNLNVSVYW